MTEKINQIGKMIVDLASEIAYLRQEQKILRQYIITPERVDAERKIQKMFQEDKCNQCYEDSEKEKDKKANKRIVL